VWAGFVVAIVVIALGIGFRARSQETRTAADIRGPFVSDEPCSGEGTKVSVDQAKADESFPVLFPNTALADSNNLDGVWECPGAIVQMWFASGVHLSLQESAMKDPSDVWKRLAEQDPSTTSVGTVRGQPASLIDPAKDPTRSIGGAVVVVDDGVQITVTGNGKQALDDLIAVTESLS